MLINCHSYYSLRYGTLSPEELAEKAADMGHGMVALTDINNTSGHLDHVRACKHKGIHPVTGIEFRNGDGFRYIGLPKNEEGVRELNEHLTAHSLSGQPFPEHPPAFEHAYLILPLRRTNLVHLRTNEFLGIRPEDLKWKEHTLLREHMGHCIALAPVSFANEDERRTHRFLRAIHHNTTLSSLEPHQEALPSEHLRSPDEIRKAFERFPTLLRNTENLLKRCSHIDAEERPRNRRFYTGNATDDRELLEKLAHEGFLRRYAPNDQVAQERLKKELDMIERLQLASYFLITWDIVRYGKGKGYYHVGRGSGANSVVAYCLQLTDVDPIELDLYFERFINPERTSPPDFDIDFSWDERDDVIEYVLKRFGHEHTALLCTFDTFKRRSSIREIAKVHGLPKAEIDELTNRLRPERKNSPTSKEILHHAERITGFPNHLGIHAGGILIAEEPLAHSTALSLPPKGFPIAHMDMHIAEDMGYHKFDILSQRGIGHIKEAVRVIGENQGEWLDIHNVEKFKNDPATKAELKAGRCTGCFYIESPAMRGLLQKLHCDDYPGLVAASSIIRPGVAQSGMMREYIRRSLDPEGYEPIHPVFEEQLKETHGVMVYQEDVIKVLHHFANLDLAEADVLRKLMSGKSRGRIRLEDIERKFFDNCRELGRKKEVAEEVWRQIESFAGYSFAKGHSASYAVESFQSLYLRTHYPLEFLTAVINNFGGFYRTEIYVKQAELLGATIHPPCINNSEVLTSIQGKDIYLGFIHMQDLEKRLARTIVQERKRNGPYTGLDNLTARVRIGREQLELLIRVGALRTSGRSRQELLWEKHHCLEHGKMNATTPRLVDTLPEVKDLPELEDIPYTDTFEQWEILGFPLCSPFELIQTSHRGDVMARDLKAYAGRSVRIMGYFVTFKPVRTVNGKRMGFAAWTDPEGIFFDTTHFPDVFQNFPLRGNGCYLIKGKVDLDFGFPSIEVEKLAKLPWIQDPRTG